MIKKIQFLAYYLPQFHPIPENDLWWGKGFTEWINVAKAKPLFKGHYQPILPSDLGFYDLRIPEVQERQANLAKEYGVDGFIYYQYWFGDGKMLLEKPAEAMLANKNIDLPFCFCWANETWKGIWHGLDSPDVLIEQRYPEEEGYEAYFEYLLPFFRDERYIKVNNKPMFHIYRLEDIPNYREFLKLFNRLAIQNGFEGIYFVATIIENETKEIINNELIYAKVGIEIFRKLRYFEDEENYGRRVWKRIRSKIRKWINNPNWFEDDPRPRIIDYAEATKKLEIQIPNQKYVSCVFPNWDNSARSGKKSLIFKNSSPQAWQEHLRIAINKLQNNPDNPSFVIIKSWNEWAEGNHLEPDLKFGTQWLEAIKNVKKQLL